MERDNAGPPFPARIIVTAHEYGDLILPTEVHRQIEEIATWVANQARILKDPGLGQHFKPGYVALFQGASGTGKTMAAAVLGKHLGFPVYGIDLSSIVSKFIGETEKNLAALFEAAERDAAILFFDEADALFGRRSEVRESHDRFANLEVSYLLERLEAFEGLAIVESNSAAAIDPAFLRRFDSIVDFRGPD